MAVAAVEALTLTVSQAVSAAGTVGQAIAFAISFYADDAKFPADTAAGLQSLLDVASTWASDEQIEWNIAKSHVLEPPDAPQHSPFTLSGQAVCVVTETE